MPQILETIDKIARDKQRDVLCITFHCEQDEFSGELSDDFDWEGDAQRQKVLAFLEENNIAYHACLPPQPTNGMLVLVSRYKGQVYVDVPYDESNELYQLLNHYLEDEHGKPRMPHVLFLYYTLEISMKNAKHDEPGFWDDM